MKTAPTTYAIRIDGHLDDHWSAWLGELDITRHNDGTTTVTVSIADQAQLHGVLAGLRDIGAVITELRTTGSPVPICRPVLARPLHAERLTLRPATADDANSTWTYRQLESVNEWLTGCPADLDAYHKLFSEPAVSQPPSSSRSATTPRAQSSATSCSAAKTPGPNSMSPTRPTTRRQN